MNPIKKVVKKLRTANDDYATYAVTKYLIIPILSLPFIVIFVLLALTIEYFPYIISYIQNSEYKIEKGTLQPSKETLLKINSSQLFDPAFFQCKVNNNGTLIYNCTIPNGPILSEKIHYLTKRDTKFDRYDYFNILTKKYSILDIFTDSFERDAFLLKTDILNHLSNRMIAIENKNTIYFIFKPSKTYSLGVLLDINFQDAYLFVFETSFSDSNNVMQLAKSLSLNKNDYLDKYIWNGKWIKP